MTAAETEILFVRMDHAEGLPLPSYATPGAAGLDLRAAVPADAPLILSPGRRALVPTGFRIAVPHGHEAQIRPRSGLALKHGVTCLNAPGTIDSDYRGEVGVILINHGSEPFTVSRGDRVAQMVLARVSLCTPVAATELDDTDRGAGGFGSTGR